MKTNQNRTSVLIAMAMILALAGGRAIATETTNYWTAGSGDYTNAAPGNWATTWTPTVLGNSTNTSAFFTNNNAGAAYTVKFTTGVTNALVHIGSPSNQAANVTFDLNGNRWRSISPYQGNPGNAAETIGFFNLAGETGTVNFSSSSAPIGTTGNQVDLLASYNVSGAFQFGADVATAGGQWSVMNINTNLGYGVIVQPQGTVYYMNQGKMVINVDGPGAGFVTAAGSSGGMASYINATRGGLVRFGTVGFYIGSYNANVDPCVVSINNAQFENGSLLYLGWGFEGKLVLTNGSTWRGSGDIQVGENRVYGSAPFNGEVFMDSSTGYLQNVVLGIAGGYSNGKMVMQNNSSVTLSNGALTVNNGLWANSAGVGQYARGNTNEFDLYNSTLNLGRAGVNGAITNWGIIRANGTISGKGSGNFLLENFAGVPVSGSTNQGTLYVGTKINPITNVFTYGTTKTTNVVTFAPGKLVLNKGNLQSDSNTWTMFNFSDSTLSQIVASNGFARLLGTNVFALAAGAPGPTNGVKYGLGVYDFVIATNNNINSAIQYDNLVNLLTNTYHLKYGVDFNYGVVNLGNGLFALELAFVPEPSAVLLLALGGLLVWRRMVKRGRKAGKAVGAVIAAGLVLILAGGSVTADTTNFWQNVGGNYSAQWTNTAYWSAASAPASTNTWVAFTNRQVTAYTVTFTTNAVNGPITVLGDSVIFDLQGNTWTNNKASSAVGNTQSMFGNGVGTNATVTFTSSTATPGNVVINSSGYSQFGYYGINGATATITITNCKVNLGNETYAANVNINVNGPGAELDAAVNTSYNIFGGTINVNNGAKAVVPIRLGTYTSGVGGQDLVLTVSNGSTLSSAGNPEVLGWGYAAAVKVLSNSTWLGGIALQIGDNRVYGAAPYNGDVLIDNSTLITSNVTIGVAGATSNGRLALQNGATAFLTNGGASFIMVNNGNSLANTNTFILDNSSIYLGRGSGNGIISNAANMRASGTITGMGTQNALLYVGKPYTNSPSGPLPSGYAGWLNIGSNSLANLTLNHANLTLGAASKTFLEFSVAGLDQIVASNGVASLLGTNQFSLVGAQTPVHGVKFGLGVYDFVIGTNVNNAVQYDNLVNLLTNTYHLQYGVDFNYGVVSLGGGLYALELAFVPEPSTVLLLALGGLLMWRRIAKRQRTVTSSQ